MLFYKFKLKFFLTAPIPLNKLEFDIQINLKKQLKLFT